MRRTGEKAGGAEVVDAAGSQGNARRDRDTCPIVDNSWPREDSEECGHVKKSTNNTHKRSRTELCEHEVKRRMNG